MMSDQTKENPLHISWHDSVWVPHLNSTNVMNYFSERSNPFYSRHCNNEFIKMQQNTRVDQLTNMQGVEYILLHTQEPILYIVRKQQRYSPTQVTPLANYHIIGGQVFQTPDLGSVINSRMLSAVSNLNSAFTELQTYSHYHPSKGYWWQFRNQPDNSATAAAKDKKQKTSVAVKEEPASVFQHRRVGALLEDLQAKFPYKYPIQPTQQQQQQQQQPPPSSSSSSQPPQQQQQQQQQPPQSQQPQPSQPSQQQSQQQQQQQTQSTQPNTPQQTPQQQQQQQDGAKIEEVKQESMRSEVKMEVKTEPKSDSSSSSSQAAAAAAAAASQRTARPPPEKRQRTGP